jgi:hypothetical protein
MRGAEAGVNVADKLGLLPATGWSAEEASNLCQPAEHRAAGGPVCGR